MNRRNVRHSVSTRMLRVSLALNSFQCNLFCCKFIEFLRFFFHQTDDLSHSIPFTFLFPFITFYAFTSAIRNVDGVVCTLIHCAHFFDATKLIIKQYSPKSAPNMALSNRKEQGRVREETSG